MPTQTKPLTVRELAAYLRICEKTAYGLAANGEVRAIKVGGQWRIPADALEQYLRGEAA